MKKTFEILGENTLVELEVMQEDKYTATEIVEPKRVQYRNCKGFEVLDGEEGKAYAELVGGDDEHDEYLVLNFEDGETASFRNSHVDLFVLKGITVLKTR